MELSLARKYAEIIDTMEPYIISYPGNWSAFDLEPWGLPIKPEHRFTATHLSSRDVVDGLHRLDSFSFGPQEMLMPRWVLFDCGEFPGLVFGFGVRASLLAESTRAAYSVTDREDDPFVPLSMWVAIRCAEDAAWFGHNLSSANVILSQSFPGLGTLTKVIAVRVTRARLQYGATQWDSSSVALHLKLGAMGLCSAYTPAHTHPETFSYRMVVDPERLARCVSDDPMEPEGPVERTLDSDDTEGILALQNEIEQGAAWSLVSVETLGEGRQRFAMKRGLSSENAT